MSYSRTLGPGSNIAYVGQWPSGVYVDFLTDSGLAQVADCIGQQGIFRDVTAHNLGGQLQPWIKIYGTLNSEMTVGQVKTEMEKAWDICRYGWFDTWPRLEYRGIAIDYDSYGGAADTVSDAPLDLGFSFSGTTALLLGAAVFLLFLLKR